MKTVNIESECIVKNLDFPKVMDHAWLHVTSGLHIRVLNQFNKENDLIFTKKVSHKKHILTIKDNFYWSNNDKINSIEVYNCLNRANKIFNGHIFESIDILTENRLTVVLSSYCEDNIRILSSPIFTITPSCRDNISQVTCGPYRPYKIYKDKYSFIKIDKHPFNDSNSPEIINIVFTNQTQNRYQLLHDGVLDLTSPLGANPDEYKQLKNTQKVKKNLELFVSLRILQNNNLNKNDITFLKNLSETINRYKLAESTSLTMLPFNGNSEIISSSNETVKAPKRIKLFYVNYHPNKNICLSLLNQIKEIYNLTIDIEEVEYSEYCKGLNHNELALSLEIFHKNIYSDSFYEKNITNINNMSQLNDFVDTNKSLMIPILRCLSTQVTRKNYNLNIKSIGCDGTYFWSKL